MELVELAVPPVDVPFRVPDSHIYLGTQEKSFRCETHCGELTWYTWCFEAPPPVMNTDGIQMFTSTLAPKLSRPWVKNLSWHLKDRPGGVLAAQAGTVLSVLRQRTSHSHQLLSESDQGCLLHLESSIFLTLLALIALFKFSAPALSFAGFH